MGQETHTLTQKTTGAKRSLGHVLVEFELMNTAGRSQSSLLLFVFTKAKHLLNGRHIHPDFTG